MRLLLRFCLASLALLVAKSALYAQTSLHAAAGLALATGSFGDAHKSGYNISAGIGLKPLLAPVGVRVEAMLNQFDAKNPASYQAMRTLGATANATFSAQAVPAYLIGGVGIYSTKALDVSAGLASQSNEDVGFNVGAGLNFPLTGIGTYAEIRFHRIRGEADPITFIPITFGLRF